MLYLYCPRYYENVKLINDTDLTENEETSFDKRDTEFRATLIISLNLCQIHPIHQT